MKLRACLAGLAWACCLALTPHAHAANARIPFYAVTLQAPQAQRKLLENHLELYRWRDSERMDETQLRLLVDQAPDQVRSLLATEGFYSPQVRATLQSSGGGWSVDLEVRPGEPVRITGLELKIAGALDDGSAASQGRLAQIRADWSLHPGAVFRHADWEAAKRAALRKLLLQRYPAAAIQQSQATVDPEARSAALGLTLDSGPAFSFGALQIQGLRRYPTSVIERLNPIQSGETYDQAKLLEFQSRLQDSPYFASASVQVTTDPLHPVEVPVQVSVEEKRARTLGLGVGVSTDTGPRAQLDYRDLNLLDQAWRLSSILKLATKEQSLGSELQFPQTRKGYRHSLNAGWARSDVEGEVTRTLTLGAWRTRLENRIDAAYGVRYLHEQQDVSGGEGEQRSALTLSWSWTHRDVDSLLFPTRGTLVNIQFDGAAKALLSDQSFLRSYGRATWFHPVGDKGQLILRGELGAVMADSRNGIPSDFLFRTGGDQTVRGYAYQSLGVREGNAIVGGRWLSAVSGEYVYWLGSQWGVAAFVDAGDAADSFSELHYRVGYGLGARWKSPVGPLNLDLAYGRETEALRLHFSVGFSF